MYQVKRTYDHQPGALTAIIIDSVNGKAVGRKYRNIKDNAIAKERFCSHAKRVFPNATHVNFYEKDSKDYKEQIRLTTGDTR
jgi:hypothetical protein